MDNRVIDYKTEENQNDSGPLVLYVVQKTSHPKLLFSKCYHS